MEPEGGLWIYIILLLFLIFSGAFFTMAEVSIISLNDSKVKKMAINGNKKAKILVKMIEEPSKFMSTLNLSITFIVLLTSAVTAYSLSGIAVDYASNHFTDYEFNQDVLELLSLLVINIILSFLVILLTNLVPRRIAAKRYEEFAFRIAGLLYFFFRILKPFVWLLSISANLVLRICGIDPNEKIEEVTEEEIRMMIDVGNEIGTIEQSEKDMIHNIFDFGDREVDEIMTHRTEIVAIESTDSLKEVVEIALEEGYSRLPVYEEDLDNIIGVLNIKDLLKLLKSEEAENFVIKDFMRPALYVPEANKCKDLFKEFQNSKVQLAIIVDEYGGTAGIVTMEDLLESIVGNIQDEYDDEDEEVTQIKEDTYIIDGMYSLDKIEKMFDINFFEDEEDYDYDTISGFITGNLGRIPAKGEQPTVKVDNVEFKVLEVEEHRVTKVEALVLPVEEKDEED